MEKNFLIDHKLKMAYDFTAQGRYLHAVQIYQSVLEENPFIYEAVFNLAELYEQSGNLESGLKLLNESLKNDPENKKLRLFLGQFLLRNSMWEESIDTLSFILPEEEPIASFFTGYSHFMLDEFEIARINFINFINSEEEDEFKHEALLYLVKIEIKLENFESALNYAKKTEYIYSNFWELNKLFAVIYYHMDMHAHAVLPVEKAIRLNPKEPSSYEWAGKIYMKTGDYLKAENFFLKFIELTENASSETYTNLAQACLKSSKAKAALEYFDLALKINPENKTAFEGKKNASTILKKNKASDG